MKQSLHKYKPSSHYDSIYNNVESYKQCYMQSPYFVLWENVIKLIQSYPVDSRIIDAGCGPGQFGLYLHDCGYKNYTGIDFSPVAIQLAQQKNVQRYEVADCTKFNYKPYQIVIALEVLEHLMNDIALLKKIPDGKPFIFSVPSYSSSSHVRTYDEKIIQIRFAPYLKDLSIYKIKLKPGLENYIYYGKGIINKCKTS